MSAEANAPRRGIAAKPGLVFWSVLALLLLAGLGRSWVATRLDSFTIDEAWHVVAGVSYARTSDYRLNPEHPPLVKSWAGAGLSEQVFRLPPFRALVDKEGERAFINEVIYRENDPERVHAYTRVSMLALHGLLLVALAWSLRRVCDPSLALVSVGLLLVDPTVAAHLPLVMTDLSVALLSATAALLAFIAFRSWRIADLGLASLALGLTLAAKHSGVITGLAVVGIAGVLWLLGRAGQRWRVSLYRLGGILGVLFGAYLVLWAFYGFRFLEGSDTAPGHGNLAASVEVAQTSALNTAPLLFNRSMADKIADLRSGTHRVVLQLAVDTHFLPRAYLWGLADILRVGMEGRYETLYVFGHRVDGGTPWYFFPAVLLGKLPLGWVALCLLGAFLLLQKRVPEPWVAPVRVLGALSALFMLFLMRGNSGYAGVRHALPVVPYLAVLGALPITLGLASQGRLLRGGALAGLTATLASALPVMRPWEYYNELVGGAPEAWRYFTDDGVDIRQRTKELGWYYDTHIRGSAEPAYEFYDISEEEREGRHFVFRSLEDDEADTDTLSGTVFFNARWLAPRPIYDYAVFRSTEPIARFGNLLVFRGSFQIPWLRAARRVGEAWEAMAPEIADFERAEHLFEQAVALYPEDYGSSLELGNLRVKRGAREAAIVAYATALAHAPSGDAIVGVLSHQIEQLSQQEISGIEPIRNPWLE